MDLSDENAVYQIVNRAISLRFCLELWAQDKQKEDLHDSLKVYSVKNITREKRSFKIIVETFCKHFSQREKVDKIEVSKYFNNALKYYDNIVTLCYFRITFYAISTF